MGSRRTASLPLALDPLQTLLQVVQVGGGGRGGAGAGRRSGARVVLLLVQLPGLLQLRQLAVEHVGGRGHGRLGGQQGGDGRPLRRLVLTAESLRRQRGAVTMATEQFHS